MFDLLGSADVVFLALELVSWCMRYRPRLIEIVGRSGNVGKSRGGLCLRVPVHCLTYFKSRP